MSQCFDCPRLGDRTAGRSVCCCDERRPEHITAAQVEAATRLPVPYRNRQQRRADAARRRSRL